MVFETDLSTGLLTIHPTDTRPWKDGFLGPKYSKIRSLILPTYWEPEWERDPDGAAVWILEELPSGFTKDYEYGLGLAHEFNTIIDFIEDNTSCSSIKFVESDDLAIIGEHFVMSLAKFDSLCKELTRIKNRGDGGIRRVRDTHVHNYFAEDLNLEPRKLSLGRLPTSKWITQVAAGDTPLNDDEQDALLAATSASAARIAANSPAKMARLQRDIELVNLDQLISAYSAALESGHPEAWWQAFFEENIFALQLLFGGPTVFIDSQVPIGEGDNSPKGKKIADYLLKNAMTNNASLVEIKRPSTSLLKKRAYRVGVYGVHSEIGEVVTQVLDQALQLTRHETDTKARTSDNSWSGNAPRCFVVVGRTSELDDDHKRKSFDLYREHLSGVRIVTYDEILGQLQTLRDFLAEDALA
jgi:hypothetical protein